MLDVSLIMLEISETGDESILAYGTLILYYNVIRSCGSLLGYDDVGYNRY